MQEEQATKPCATRVLSTRPQSHPTKTPGSRHVAWFEDAVMRGFLIGLSISLAFIVGCVASSTRYGVPKAEAAAVVEQRWSYFCVEAASVDDVNFKANAAGMRGWEMVGLDHQQRQRPDGLVLPPATPVAARRQVGKRTAERTAERREGARGVNRRRVLWSDSPARRARPSLV